MKIFLPFLISFSCVLFATAQKKEVPLKDYFSDAEYFFIQEDYIDALSDYLEISKKGYENNANINYHIGICYLNIPGLKDKSIPYLESATINASSKYRESSLNEMHAPLDAYLFLGNAYRINYQLDSAVSNYRHYLELIIDRPGSEKEYIEKQIEACYIAQEFINSPRRVLFTNFGQQVNTNSSNYNPIISGDGNTMVYMTQLPFYEAVFMSRKRGKNWTRPTNITPQIMSDGDQVVTGISFDGTSLLLVKSDAFNSDIHISEFKEGEWTKSKPISKSINSKFWESHASFAADGKTIYFTSNKNGGFGAMDIYKSELDEKGNWGEASNLGNGVNTPLNEDTPFITTDGKKLYYSSQGHRNMGGYDFFFSEFNDSIWINPQNLNYPLSTTDEDLFYYPVDNGDRAYVYRILEEGFGGYDIYEVSYPTEEEIEDAIAEQIIADIDEEIDELETDAINEPLVIELTPILFDFDKSLLTNSAKKQIVNLIQLLKLNPDISLNIIGHTDALGPATYNLFLSERRAKGVAKYFLDAGIEANRIHVSGKGETEFVATNTTASGDDNPDGRKYNRRAEFELIGYDTEWFIIKKIDSTPKDLRIPRK